MQKILPLLKNKDVYIFGTSPHISNLFLKPINIDLVCCTYSVQAYPESCQLNDVQIKLDQYKKKLISNYFKSKVKGVILGTNLFSAYFPVDIAMWIDGGTKWLPREILNNTDAKYILTTPQIAYKIEDWGFNKSPTNFFEYTIKGINDTYKLWTQRTVITTALHLCAVGGAANVYVSGCDFNSLIASHFYENINIKKVFSFANKDTILGIEKLKIKYPNTNFYKTNPKSYLPFHYKELV